MPYCPEADHPWDVTENSLVSVPVPIPHIKMELGIQVWFFKNIKSGFWSQFKNSDLVLIQFLLTQTGTSG
jgi:hypothetical protein